MTLPALQKRLQKGEVLFAFNNSEALTDGIIFLYKKTMCDVHLNNLFKIAEFRVGTLHRNTYL